MENPPTRLPRLRTSAHGTTGAQFRPRYREMTRPVEAVRPGQHPLALLRLPFSKNHLIEIPMTEPRLTEVDSWTWTGDSLPSKKNSKRIILRHGKPSIISSSEYLEWENGFVREIKSLGTRVGKCAAASITITAPNRRRWDLSNKWESVADALVKA